MSTDNQVIGTEDVGTLAATEPLVIPPAARIQQAVGRLTGGAVIGSLAKLAELCAVVSQKSKESDFPALQKGHADAKLEQIEGWLTGDPASGTYSVVQQADEFIADLQQWVTPAKE